jgi:hypothetical protein
MAIDARYFFNFYSEQVKGSLICMSIFCKCSIANGKLLYQRLSLFKHVNLQAGR